MGGVAQFREGAWGRTYQEQESNQHEHSVFDVKHATGVKELQRQEKFIEHPGQEGRGIVGEDHVDRDRYIVQNRFLRGGALESEPGQECGWCLSVQTSSRSKVEAQFS